MAECGAAVAVGIYRGVCRQKEHSIPIIYISSRHGCRWRTLTPCVYASRTSSVRRHSREIRVRFVFVSGWTTWCEVEKNTSSQDRVTRSDHFRCPNSHDGPGDSNVNCERKTQARCLWREWRITVSITCEKIIEISAIVLRFYNVRWIIKPGLPQKWFLCY